MKNEKIFLDYTKFIHFTINQKIKSEIFIKSQVENIVEKNFPFDSNKYDYKIVNAKKIKYLILWNTNEKIQKNKKYYSPLIILKSLNPEKNLIYISEKYFIEFFNDEIKFPQSIELLEEYLNKIQNKDSYLFYTENNFNNTNLNFPIFNIHSVFNKRNIFSIKLSKIKYSVFFNFIFLLFIFILLFMNFSILKKNQNIQEKNRILKSEILNMPDIFAIENQNELSFNTKLISLSDKEIMFDSICIDESKFEINVSGKDIENYYRKLLVNPKIKNCVLENIFSKNQISKTAIITGEFCFE